MVLCPESDRPTVWLGLLANLLLMISGAANADRFGAGFDRAEWRLSASELECRLWQPIPNFGEGVFRQRAGEQEQFMLTAFQPVPAGDALVRIEPPTWRKQAESSQLGTVSVKASDTPVMLGDEFAGQLLSSLQQGLNPVFDQMAYPSLGGQASVSLVAVNFKRAYTDYQDCRSHLIPATYAEVSRTRIDYGPGQWELSDDEAAHLDLVVRHVEADPAISTIYVDGYSDASGKRSTNLEISKKRAEAVVHYLQQQGIPLERITMRYHGSRYPVAPGFSAQARAQNRRVTVRLEKG